MLCDCLFHSEQSRFLAHFMDICRLSLIQIPGPLVLFFRSLSVSQPGFRKFELVGPALPPLSYSEERLYAMDYTIPNTNTRFTGIDLMIPHIPLMLDQFRQLFTIHNNLQEYSAWTQLSKIFGMDEPAAGSAHSLGFAYRPNTTSNEAHTPVPADPTADPPVVARDAQWTVYGDLISSLGFSQSADWFHLLLRGMPTFTQHFKGNVRLSDISPATSTAAMIRFKEVAYAALPAHNPFSLAVLNKASHHLVFNTYGVTPCSNIPSEDFEDAQIAQVNVSCPYVFGTDTKIGRP
nr:hypothetical protein [Tanacetum cinerariifolium]